MADIELVDLREHPEWVEMLASWHQRQWPDKGDLKTRVVAFRRHLQLAHIPTTLVLLVESRPVGSVSLLQYSSSRDRVAKPSFWVANVYVVVEERCRGYGRVLLHGIEVLARQLGIRKLQLYTSDQWQFYQHLGWYVEAQKDIAGDIARVMIRDLGSDTAVENTLLRTDSA